MSYINRKIKQLVSKFNKKKTSRDNYKENENKVESELDKLNISDNDSSSVNINHENCYVKNVKPWCKECVPRCIIKGWTSENHDIDEFIKETIYNAKMEYNNNNKVYYPLFLKWVPFDRFEDIKQIGEGGFAKVYSTTWVDGETKYERQDDGIWKKKESSPMKVALKRLNDSQNISVEYLNELQIHWNYFKENNGFLKFYGMTKDPVTKEFMMIIEFSEKGNLRSVLSKGFNNILWKHKLMFLNKLSFELDNFHKLGYCHKDLHSGNVLQIYHDGYKSNVFYISDFGLSGPLNKQKSDGKICGVLPYVAPEVLNKKPYTTSSDIYSFGVIMAELSSGKPPFHKRKHDAILALEICNGLRPEFGKRTPEIYKKLAYRCMNANPDQRPTAEELHDIMNFWRLSCTYDEDEFQEKEKFGFKGKEIKVIFEEADKEIPNISTTYEKNPDAIYTSRLFSFNNLSKPINSPIITSYLNEEDNKDCQDSQLLDLEVPSSSLQSREIIDDENSS